MSSPFCPTLLGAFSQASVQEGAGGRQLSLTLLIAPLGLMMMMCVASVLCVCVCFSVCVFICLFIYDDGSCWWWCIVNDSCFAWLINTGQLDLYFIHVTNDARRYRVLIMSCHNNICLQHSCCIWTCVAGFIFNQNIKYMRKQLDAFFSSWLETHLGSTALPVCTSTTLSSAWSCTDTGEPFLLGREDVSPKKKW